MERRSKAPPRHSAPPPAGTPSMLERAWALAPVAPSPVLPPPVPPPRHGESSSSTSATLYETASKRARDAGGQPQRQQQRHVRPRRQFPLRRDDAEQSSVERVSRFLPMADLGGGDAVQAQGCKEEDDYADAEHRETPQLSKASASRPITSLLPPASAFVRGTRRGAAFSPSLSSSSSPVTRPLADWSRPTAAAAASVPITGLMDRRFHTPCHGASPSSAPSLDQSTTLSEQAVTRRNVVGWTPTSGSAVAPLKLGGGIDDLGAWAASVAKSPSRRGGGGGVGGGVGGGGGAEVAERYVRGGLADRARAHVGAARTQLVLWEAEHVRPWQVHAEALASSSSASRAHPPALSSQLGDTGVEEKGVAGSESASTKPPSRSVASAKAMRVDDHGVVGDAEGHGMAGHARPALVVEPAAVLLQAPTTNSAQASTNTTATTTSTTASNSAVVGAGWSPSRRGVAPAQLLVLCRVVSGSEELRRRGAHPSDEHATEEDEEEGEGRWGKANHCGASGRSVAVPAAAAARRACLIDKLGRPQGRRAGRGAGHGVQDGNAGAAFSDGPRASARDAGAEADAQCTAVGAATAAAAWAYVLFSSSLAAGSGASGRGRGGGSAPQLALRHVLRHVPVARHASDVVIVGGGADGGGDGHVVGQGGGAPRVAAVGKAMRIGIWHPLVALPAHGTTPWAKAGAGGGDGSNGEGVPSLVATHFALLRPHNDE